MKNPNEVIRSETPADGAYAAMQGPYIHTGNSVRSRMNDVSAALLCLLVWATVQFGTRVISLTLLSVLSAVRLDPCLPPARRLSSVVSGARRGFGHGHKADLRWLGKMPRQPRPCRKTGVRTALSVLQ